MVDLRSGPEGIRGITRNNVDLTVALIAHRGGYFLVAAGLGFARHVAPLEPHELEGEPISPMVVIGLEMSGCIRLHRRAAEAVLQGDEENVYQAEGVEITAIGLFLVDKLKRLEIGLTEAKTAR